nr:HPr family phosphocarrier protein [Corynebacterium uterequi]
MITRTATIGSSVGLHARPAALFVQAVEDTGYEITIALDGEEAVDADSVLEVMTLGAGHGDVVTLACEDEAAAGALDELVALLERDLDQE